eukprot:scaffold392_cov350-Prasinococcus_capsulatus_cf.AAC.10
MHDFWEVVEYLANTLIFALSGLLIGAHMLGTLLGAQTTSRRDCRWSGHKRPVRQRLVLSYRSVLLLARDSTPDRHVFSPDPQ